MLFQFNRIKALENAVAELQFSNKLLIDAVDKVLRVTKLKPTPISVKDRTKNRGN